MPLGAFDVDADVKSPQGSSGEFNRSIVFSVELEDDGICCVIGAGAERVRSPSRSMLEETVGVLLACIEFPIKF